MTENVPPDQFTSNKMYNKSEIIYSNIIEFSPMGMHYYELKPDNRLIFSGSNPAADKILGIKNSNFFGKTIEEAFPPLAQTEIPERYREVAKTGTTWQTEQIDYDDNKIRGAFHVVAFRTSENCMVAMFLDITELKKTEFELSRTALKFRSVFEQSSVGFVFIGMDYHFIKCNAAFCNFCGYNEFELIGKSISVISYPDDLEPGMDKLRQIADGSIESFSLQKRYIRKDGQMVWGEISTSMVRDEDKKPLYFLSVINDITDRKKSEVEKEKYEEQLQQNQKLESLGILAGGIAHDFNNLMSGVFGFIDLAIHETDRNIYSNYLSKAINTIDRARALTQQLLTFAKGGVLIQKIGPLFPFVQETAEFALSGANVSCHFDISNDLRLCNFDRNQIAQVIDNIIINAHQAMPLGGTIKLSARNVTVSDKEHPVLTKGNYIRISIKDSGIGISQENITHIFDPFFTTKEKGHGLGLATCYSIIRKHDGCIDVESDQGKGTTFNIYLPASVEPALLCAGEKPTLHIGSGRILVMDDELVIQETISAMLSRFGYSVVCKQNGEDAVSFFETEIKENRKIVCMIFDLTIPGGMGGKEAVERIRKLDIKIPIFVASGYSEDPIMKNPAEYGFTGSICKPFRITELSEMLNKYL